MRVWLQISRLVWNAGLKRVRLLALLLLVALSFESRPDSRLALGFAVARGFGSESWPELRLAFGFAVARGSRILQSHQPNTS